MINKMWIYYTQIYRTLKINKINKFIPVLPLWDYIQFDNFNLWLSTIYYRFDKVNNWVNTFYMIKKRKNTKKKPKGIWKYF